MRFGRSLQLLFGVVCLLPRAAAAGDYDAIGLHPDPAGTSACANVPRGSVATLYLLGHPGRRASDGWHGAQFRIEVTNPAGWHVIYTPPADAAVVGNPIDLQPNVRRDHTGAEVAFGSCHAPDPQTGLVDLGTVLVYNESGGPTELLVKRRSPPSSQTVFYCAARTGCTAPYFPVVCVAPHVPSTCDSFTDSLEVDSSKDWPLAAIALNREPDPRWAAGPPFRDPRRQVLVMLQEREMFVLPGNAIEAPLDSVGGDAAILATLGTFGVETVEYSFPDFYFPEDCRPPLSCFEWYMYTLTLRQAADVPRLIEALETFPQVIFAEPNCCVVIDPIDPVLPPDRFEFRAENPMHRNGLVSIRMPVAGSFTLNVYDSRGHLVRHIEMDLSVATNNVAWDGKDDAGRVLPTGVYWLRGSSGKFAATRKIVFMR